MSILSVVGADGAGLRKTDGAQALLVEEVKRMGQEAMQAWATGQVEQTEPEARRTGRAHREGKKNLPGWWTPENAEICSRYG